MERWSTGGRWKRVENRQDNRPDLTRLTARQKDWEEPHRVGYARNKKCGPGILICDAGLVSSSL